MRLDRVCIDGFKNLKGLELDFDERQLTTVLIGQNGAGKSNLIEALVQVFRWVDLRDRPPRFRFTVSYRIQPRKGKAGELAHVTLSSQALGHLTITVNDRTVERPEFEANKSEWFPDLVLGYGSGTALRLERLFDKHQQAYYKAIARNDDEEACYRARLQRRFFYCRPRHGVFALLAHFAFPDEQAQALLESKLGIAGLHSALCLFREPVFAKGSLKSKVQDAEKFWGALGPAGRIAQVLKSLALHPFGLSSSEVDDFREGSHDEAQYATYLPAKTAISGLRDAFSDDADLFYALEALDSSRLVRDFPVWVMRRNDASGDVEFHDLSDGERQLLMVMGLLRIARGQRVLVLLDEPDTHLNPHWQLSYLRLIEQWTGSVADAANSHIVLTSHNPLTISALTRNEVRVITQEADGRVTGAAPYADPRGMGFTATLTEIFGLPTTLDVETQALVDERNGLTQLVERSEAHERRLIEISDQLARLGFLFESREPLYQDFLRAWHDVRYADRPPLTPDQIALRQKAMKHLIHRLTESGGNSR